MANMNVSFFVRPLKTGTVACQKETSGRISICGENQCCQLSVAL
jgi:hypothetical protein